MKLERRIRKDLEKMGVKELDFKLDLRGYSKSLDGTYDPNSNVIVVYVREVDGMIRDYNEIMKIVIHELVHHIQWEHDPKFVRRKGIMHNTDFHKRYNKLIEGWNEVHEKDMSENDRYNSSNNNRDSFPSPEDMVSDYRIYI